jgi:hypothetical protein
LFFMLKRMGTAENRPPKFISSYVPGSQPSKDGSNRRTVHFVQKNSDW